MIPQIKSSSTQSIASSSTPSILKKKSKKPKGKDGSGASTSKKVTLPKAFTDVTDDEGGSSHEGQSSGTKISGALPGSKLLTSKDFLDDEVFDFDNLEV